MVLKDESRVVLQSLHVPALILSRSRVILAVNNAVCRLCGELSEEHLLGKDIHSLGFTLIPTEHPERFTTDGWDSLLEACESGPRGSNTPRDEDEMSIDGKLNRSSTRDFWDEEDLRFSAVADVLISHGDLVPTSGDEYPTSWLRARTSIQRLDSEGEPMYLVEFHRPLPSDSLSVPQSETSELEIEDFKTDENDESGFPSKDASEREKQVHEKVSANIPYFSALFDNTGQALHFSRSWGHVTGMPHNTTIGEGWFEAIHPDDRPMMMDAWAKVVHSQETSWTWEARYRRRNGIYYWALIRLESSERRSDKTSYWYGSLIDVDTLLRTRQESENRRKAVLKLVAHTDVCLWSLKEDRTLSLQEGSLQWDPMEALNQQTQETSYNESSDVNVDDPKFVTNLSNIVEEIFTERLTTKTLEHRDKGRWYRSTLIADHTGHAPRQHLSQAAHAVLGLTFDITDVRARVDLEVQNEILTARERAATEASELKSQFVANISHELRTPLAGIIGMNDLLMESLPQSKDGEDLRHFSENIRSSSAQLLTVINDVLDLSKIEAGRLELETVPFRICQLVDSVHGMMAVQAQRKGLSLTKIIDVLASLVVVGDLNRLHQIFLNLLGNSIKFTESGTVKFSVSVVSSPETGEQEVTDEEFRSQARSPNIDDELTQIKFVVEDTGCGMSKITTEKIFEAFSQADSSTARHYGGTGLGLTISRQLVEMMGGSISFTSTLDVGTKAVVIIPFRIAVEEIKEASSEIADIFENLLAKVESVAQTDNTSLKTSQISGQTSNTASGFQRSAHPAHATLTLSMTDRNTKLVLIVEDNAINMKIAILMTKKLGLQAITASNGEEALEILDSRARSQQLPSPDIILMDCMMPVMDGYKATQNLRQDKDRFSASTRSIPIIALTASAHKGDKERCLEAGMDDYLIKPVNKSKLEDSLLYWASIGLDRLAQIREDDTPDRTD